MTRLKKQISLIYGKVLRKIWFLVRMILPLTLYCPFFYDMVVSYPMDVANLCKASTSAIFGRLLVKGDVYKQSTGETLSNDVKAERPEPVETMETSPQT